ncbi:MAG: hypothetical protein AAF674_15690 [Pseudomonadota bacterium]
MTTMYDHGRQDDQVDLLAQIVGLAIVGAASTDTCLNLKPSSIECGQRALFEVIYRLAAEAHDMADEQSTQLTKAA